MLDFPSSPVLNQQFSAANSSWVWDGTAWNIVPQMVPAVASDTPPSNPAVGQFWWRSSNGQLYVYYLDPGGPPGQWVQAAASAGFSKVVGGLITISNSAPSSPTVNDVWIDTT